MSPAGMIKIAKLVAFDDLKHLSLSELLWFPSFLTLAKQCEDPSANILQQTLQSKFGSKESDPLFPQNETNSYHHREHKWGSSDMNFSHFLLCYKTSNNPDFENARLQSTDSYKELLRCSTLSFSSPEHEVLMVSYCDQSLSVVRALLTFCFKRLLQNG